MEIEREGLLLEIRIKGESVKERMGTKEMQKSELTFSNFRLLYNINQIQQQLNNRSRDSRVRTNYGDLYHDYSSHTCQIQRHRSPPR